MRYLLHKTAVIDRRYKSAMLGAMDWKNKLYFGDNLKILCDYVEDASVDLIYLDPPFNSSATYKVLFKEKGGEESAAQALFGLPHSSQHA